MLTFCPSREDGRTSKRRHETEFDVVLLQDLVLGLGLLLYALGGVQADEGQHQAGLTPAARSSGRRQ